MAGEGCREREREPVYRGSLMPLLRTVRSQPNGPSGWHTDASQRTRPGMRQVGALNQLPFSSLEANTGGCPGSLPSCDLPSSA